MLMYPTPGKPLFIYISSTSIALGVLISHHDENGKEGEVYYIVHTLVGYEINYSPIEKECLEVVFNS